jgi:hypothetical protein
MGSWAPQVYGGLLQVDFGQPIRTSIPTPRGTLVLIFFGNSKKNVIDINFLCKKLRKNFVEKIFQKT